MDFANKEPLNRCCHLSAIAIAYYLFLPTLESICIAAKQRRAAFYDSYTWHFSTQGLPAIFVAKYGRSLLHYIFTLTPALQQWRLFSVALSVTSSTVLLVITPTMANCTRPLAGGLPCAVRTFLAYLSKHDSSVCSR